MKFEPNMDFETVTGFKEVSLILATIEKLQIITTDPGLLQDLKDTFSHYEGIKHDMMIDISNELGLQFEAFIRNSL